MKFFQLFSFLVLFHSFSIGQLNYIENGHKAIYWGISLGFNTSSFNVDRIPFNSKNDTITSVKSKSGLGFNLGLIGNWQFNKFFDLRFIPSMVFSEQVVEYSTAERSVETRVNGAYLTFPLLVRFKSVPIKDMRIFLLGGLKYEYNIASQYRPAATYDMIPLKKGGLNFEYGIGIQYFFPYFIFSPEIKFSHGIDNMLGPNQTPLNNTILNGLFPKSFTLSINFEG